MGVAGGNVPKLSCGWKTYERIRRELVRTQLRLENVRAHLAGARPNPTVGGKRTSESGGGWSEPNCGWKAYERIGLELVRTQLWVENVPMLWRDQDEANCGWKTYE